MTAQYPGFSTPMDMKTSTRPSTTGASQGAGFLIVNADDWGRDRETSDRMFECVLRGTVSSVSAMVFLVLWWSRHIVVGRRARRPAPAPA